MRNRPKKLATEEELYVAALKALMRRAHSVYEMRQALERRMENKETVQHVLKRLKEHGYLDDARYAVQFARNRAESRGQGRYRVTRELRTRGVPDRFIEPALDEAFAEADEAAMVRRRIERKLKHLRGKPGFRGGLDQRKLASLYASLLRAGFSTDVIRRELRSITKLAAEDLPEPEEGLPTGEN